MKICLECSAEIKGNEWVCTQCNWKANHSDGVYFFAPHISGAGESYNPSWYEELASLENKNFWFNARNQLIKWLACKYLPAKGKYLELGCGTGFVLQMLRQTFPEWEINATEAQPEGITFAQQRVPNNVTFFQIDACAIPFREEFGVIGAFGIIEHVRDDKKTINKIYAALKPSGYFIVSVPQHMFLWSKRRYSATEPSSKLLSAGFTVLKSTSFNSLLLPLMALSRYTKKKEMGVSVDILHELKLSPGVNFILSAVLTLEFLISRLGFSWPVGGSRIMVAKKNFA